MSPEVTVRMGVFKAEISTEAHEIQAALDRNVKGTMTPGVCVFWGPDPTFPPSALSGTEIPLRIPSNVRSHPETVWASAGCGQF